MKRLLRSLRAAPSQPAAHMTWASGTISRTAMRTGLFLRKQLWIWPIVAIIVLAFIGFGVRRAVESTMRESLRSELETVLRLQTSMLQTWFRDQESQAAIMANSQYVRETVYRLIEETATPDDQQAFVAAQTKLRKELAPSMTSHDYSDYVLVDRKRRVVAASQSELQGQQLRPEHEFVIMTAFEGKTIVSPPFPSVVAMSDDTGATRTGLPTMFVAAPVRDASFQVVAVLAFRIPPDHEFTSILQLGTMGETGETYAFNRAGLMVSNSRFDEQLIHLGLLPDDDRSRSILTVSLRDPGGNMTAGFRPNVRRGKLPLTRMAAEATNGISGFDVDGYRDYRGVTVVGAWNWLPDYQIGVAVEMDYAEAFRPLTILRRTFYALFGMLVAASIAIFVFTVLVARAQREARKAAVEARQLGQYTLETKLGSGGMGVVYRGHHAMLRRPTAVKLLDLDKINDDAIARFEREVQLTCQLNHPCTVAIYDYGRTPEGVFYYAMEYLDGLTLQTLVERYGPQPEGRVIRILNQICGSLFEAHSLGLVHRDVKPANVMINRRGGEADVVKVLDFGLVKALDEDKAAQQTGANLMAGTPLYMSPEAIQTPNLVDARSDIYAVGAVGYYLLTGRPVFEAESLVVLCQRHVSESPVPPSQRPNVNVSPEFEAAIMACLEKNRARRPQTARDLANMFTRSPAADSWSLDDADAWWGRHERGLASTPTGQGPSTAAAMGRTVLTDSVSDPND